MGGINIPPEVVIGIGGGVIMLLILSHVGLLAINMGHLARHRHMQKEWEKMTSKYSVEGIPQVVLIDRQGKVRMVSVGGEDKEKTRAIRRMIQKLLDEKA